MLFLLVAGCGTAGQDYYGEKLYTVEPLIK